MTKLLSPVPGIRALVPIKRFGAAKTRLAARLGREARSALAQAMMEDVLEALSAAHGLGGILVVTSDPAARTLALARGCDVLDDPYEAGTNAAVAHGLRHLAQAGCAGALVVPGDIPFVAPKEIETVLGTMAWNAVVLVPAHRDGGTNLLGLAGAAAIPPAFGPQSFARHIASARNAGIEPLIFGLEGAGIDIDVPADLDLPLVLDGSGRRTRELLAGFAGAHAVSEMRRQELSLP
jgi:2-phospho-L-lactate guanylyltransferase